MFNLAQWAGETISARDAETMSRLRKEWDAAARASAIRQAAPEAPKTGDKHAKLPWRITDAPRKIVGADGATVANLTALDLPNAELIVVSVNASTGAAPEAPAKPIAVRDALRRCGADTDYHGKMLFTVPQFDHFVSMICPAPATQQAGAATPTMPAPFQFAKFLLAQQGAAQALVRPLDDPKMAAYLRNEPWISAYIETLECELRKAQAAHAVADTEHAEMYRWLRDDAIYQQEGNDGWYEIKVSAPLQDDVSVTAQQFDVQIRAAMSAATEAKEQK
jgi:hypothetical protein